jgi:hypothetical protein
MRPNGWALTREECALAAVVTSITAVDVVLIRGGHGSLSGVIRRNKVLRAAVIVLGAHLLVTQPYDPIHHLGKIIAIAGSNAALPDTPPPAVSSLASP